jgi:hypothetical protein
MYKKKVMKKLRQFEIDAICDEAYKLIKEKKTQQIQITFDEFEGKEALLEVTDKLLEKHQQIKQLQEEESKLITELSKSKEILKQKGVLFHIVYNSGVTHHISVIDTSSIYRDMHREIILQGIDEGNSVRDFIKELVEKFS